MSIRKILLFRHISVCGNLLNTLADYVAAELNKRNIAYEYIDITKPQPEVFEELNNKIDDSFDAAIMFNDPGFHNFLTEQGDSLFDKFGISFFNWVVDHPVSQLHYLESKCRNYNLICIDRYHVDFVKRYRPQINSVSFLPLAGISDKKEMAIPFSERKYDVAFPGSVQSATLDEALNVYKKLSFPNNEIVLNLIDYLMDNRKTDATVALDVVLKERFEIDSLDDNDYAIALQLAEQANSFMRNFAREEVLRQLAGSNINVHVFGNGWENRLNVKNAHMIFHKPVSFAESEPIFGDCKILLNIMPCFKDGIHDRIPSGMLHRAVVMTDHSKYLDELPEGLMSFYDIDNVKELPDKLHELLADADKAQKIADAGHDYAVEHFTWEKTVDELIRIIEEVRTNRP